MNALQALRAPIFMSLALVVAFAMALVLCGYVARAVIRMEGGLGKPQSEAVPMPDLEERRAA
jgi:hypothetical protein